MSTLTIKIYPSEVELLREELEKSERKGLKDVQFSRRDKPIRILSLKDANAIVALAEVSFAAAAEYILYDIKS